MNEALNPLPDELAEERPLISRGLAACMIMMGAAAVVMMAMQPHSVEPVQLGAYVLPVNPYEDAVSKVVHPPIIRAGNEEHPLMLLGAGVPINMSSAVPSPDGVATNQGFFSLSYYIEPGSAREELSEYQGLSSADLRASSVIADGDADGDADEATNKFYAEHKFAISHGYLGCLATARSDKALRMSFSQKIPKRAAWTSISDTIHQSISLSHPNQPSVAESMIDSFHSLFPLPSDDSSDFHKGDELLISVTDGDLSVQHNRNLPAAVLSNAHALADEVFRAWGTAGGALLGRIPETYGPEAVLRFPDRAPLLWSWDMMKQKVQCPQVNAVKNLDETAFFNGRWYEVQRSTMTEDVFERNARHCSHADYRLTGDPYLPVEITNTGMNKPGGISSSVKGKARPVDKGKFEVKFFDGPLPTASLEIIDVVGDPNTGYDAALVYSCLDGLGLESAWVMSRSPILSETTQAQLLAKASQKGVRIDTLDMRAVPQDDCWDEETESN